MSAHRITFDLFAPDGYSYPVTVEVTDTSDHPPRRVTITIAAPPAIPGQLPADHISVAIARNFLCNPQLISATEVRGLDQRTQEFDGIPRGSTKNPWRWENVTGAIPSGVS